MKKTITGMIVSAASILALSTTAFATGNGVVGGVVEGAEDIVGGVVEGVGDVVGGVAEGVGDVANGVGNTANELIDPVENDATNDAVTQDDMLESTARTTNPSTGISTVPYAIALGSMGAAAIAAVSRRRK